MIIIKDGMFSNYGMFVHVHVHIHCTHVNVYVVVRSFSCSDCLAFATEPIFASVSNLLGFYDNLPTPLPLVIKVRTCRCTYMYIYLCKDV